jgi:hypothetical protein
LPCNVELLKMRGDPWHSSSPAAQARMTAVPQLLRGIGSPDARWIAAAGQSRRDIARTSQSAFCRTIPHGALREFERGMARLGHCRDLPGKPPTIVAHRVFAAWCEKTWAFGFLRRVNLNFGFN